MSSAESQSSTGPSLTPLDLEHEQKRVRSIIRTPEGREALRREFGLNFVFVEDAELQNIPIIHMLMPTHSGGAKPQTNRAVEEMIMYTKGHAIVVPDPSVSSSVVHWVRNDLVTNLYKSRKPFHYTLLIDDDIVPPKDALVKLLAWDKDIIAGACTVRQDPPMPNFRMYYPDEMTYRTAKDWRALSPEGKVVKDGLIEVGGVGTGFMLIKREALETVGEYYLSCRHERDWFGLDGERLARIEKGRRDLAARTLNQWWFEFLKQPLGEGEFGEDISFCFKATQCGLKVWVDTSVRCGHVGSYAYSLDDFCGPMEEEAPALAEVTA
jgi:hypothetical protein